jgi:hypothetical protein
MSNLRHEAFELRRVDREARRSREQLADVARRSAEHAQRREAGEAGLDTALLGLPVRDVGEDDSDLDELAAVIAMLFEERRARRAETSDVGETAALGLRAGTDAAIESCEPRSTGRIARQIEYDDPTGEQASAGADRDRRRSKSTRPLIGSATRMLRQALAVERGGAAGTECKWCRRCGFSARIDRNYRRATLCRWCGDYQSNEGSLPDRVLVVWHHRNPTKHLTKTVKDQLLATTSGTIPNFRDDSATTIRG